MDKFFNYYNSLCSISNSYDAFSYDPYINAIKKLFVSELQQIVYYIEKLKNLNFNMSEYTDKVIEFIYLLIVNLDFNKDSFFLIINDLYNNKIVLKDMYISASDSQGKKPELLFINEPNLSSKEEILKALNEKEKNIKVDFYNINKEKRVLYEIIINLVLNACNYLIELKEFQVDVEDEKNQVLKFLNTTNIPSLSDEELVLVIKNFSFCNYKIMKYLYENIINKYGPVSKKEVCFCIKKGKAILVSGNSLRDLEKILIAVKDTDVNVYTHNEMISAFQYEKFFQYSNLIGHYQKLDNNFSLDFSFFPGPIYISRNMISKVDVIRGQIYTSAKYPPFGIAKIQNNDFSPIIDYASKSIGFSDNEYLNKVEIGYNNEDVSKNISMIIREFRNNKIKKIAIIGLFDRFNNNSEYIKQFLDICPDEVFILSFSYSIDRKNVWHVNSYFDFCILYKIIELLIENIPDIKNNISIFLIDCNSSIVSHIFNLVYLGINNIFLGPCCPNILNPKSIENLSNLFGIKQISKVIDDIEHL